ncbi:hypothetical protein K7432_002144 [Basidiobolus ranarum]
MCGIGEKADRRPIDPPPIIQLRVSDAAVKLDKTSFLYNPYYFMYASLMLADSDDEMHLLHDGKTRSTTGSLVSSLYHLKDVNNSDGGFFVFPDLSVRMEGRYRLKFTLFEIVGMEVFYCSSICSDTFTVYSAKRFPGMEESTFLSRSFADQGLKIRIRKEVRIRRRGSKWKDNVGSPSDQDNLKFESKSPSSVKAPENDNRESEASISSEDDNVEIDERRKRFSEDTGYHKTFKRRSADNPAHTSSESPNFPPGQYTSSQSSYSPGSQPYLDKKRSIKSTYSNQSDIYSPVLSKQWRPLPELNYKSQSPHPSSSIQDILNSEKSMGLNHTYNERSRVPTVLISPHSLPSSPITISRSNSKSVLSIQNILSPQNGPYPAPIPTHNYAPNPYPEIREYEARQASQSHHSYLAVDRPYDRPYEGIRKTYSSDVATHSGWSDNYTPSAQLPYQLPILPDQAGYSHTASLGTNTNSSINRLPNISSLINPPSQPSNTPVSQYPNPHSGNHSNRFNQFQ